MARKKTSVARARERRDAMLKRKAQDAPTLSDAQRKTILRLIAEGATLSEVFTIRGIASYGSFFAARVADQVYDDDVRRALAQGAEAAIAEAAELSRAAADSANPDDMRVAEAFHRCALSYAEKAAPREYGQLIKLGGVDGGALSIAVVNYALPAPAVGKSLQSSDPSHARAIPADFDDIAET